MLLKVTGDLLMFYSLVWLSCYIREHPQKNFELLNNIWLLTSVAHPKTLYSDLRLQKHLTIILWNERVVLDAWHLLCHQAKTKKVKKYENQVIHWSTKRLKWH